MSLKSTEELCIMTMKNDANFEEEMTCHFKIDMRNLMNFDPSTQTGTLMGSFCPKQKMYEIKIYRGVMCHDNEEKCKIWRRIDSF